MHKFFRFCHHKTMTSFPCGPCCIGVDCRTPEHQLRKHCPGCNGLIHMLCSRYLLSDEGDFKEDSVLCPRCDPKKHQPQPSVGLKSPRQAFNKRPFSTSTLEVVALMNSHEEDTQ